MLDKLPPEIKLQLLQYVSISNLNVEYYALQNELYRKLCFKLVGPDLVLLYDQLKLYVRSIEKFRSCQRQLLAKHLQLTLDKLYLYDSWFPIYMVLKNRKLFFTSKDVSGDQVVVDRTGVEFKYTHSFVIARDIILPEGNYSLQTWVRKNPQAHGLGTTKFEVIVNGCKISGVFPPSNILEMIPDNKDCCLNMGSFTLDAPQLVTIAINELGFLPKYGFKILYADLKPVSKEIQKYLFFVDQDPKLNPYETLVHVNLHNILYGYELDKVDCDISPEEVSIMYNCEDHRQFSFMYPYLQKKWDFSHQVQLEFDWRF